MKRQRVTLETVDSVCMAYLTVSPLKKEKIKTYIYGIMDGREAAEYEKAIRRTQSSAHPKSRDPAA